jgi:hypothetical protein
MAVKIAREGEGVDLHEVAIPIPIGIEILNGGKAVVVVLESAAVGIQRQGARVAETAVVQRRTDNRRVLSFRLRHPAE